MQIKICGITNLEDAVAAVEAGADALGFNFYPGSQRHITPQQVQLITRQLPVAVLKVGVFVNVDTPEAVLKMAAEAGVTAVQLHGEESPEYCQGLKGVYVIKALRVGRDFKPTDALKYDAEAILLDAFDPGARGGTGRTFDWHVAQQTQQLIPKLFLAGGLVPANIAEAVAVVRPYGVDACSGVETTPGRNKDAEQMRAFILAARRAAA